MTKTDNQIFPQCELQIGKKRLCIKRKEKKNNQYLNNYMKVVLKRHKNEFTIYIYKRYQNKK